MIAFTASTPLVSRSQLTGATTFTRVLDVQTPVASRGARMALRTGIAPSTGLATSRFGGIDKVLGKADEYMAQSVLNQYMAMSQPTGVYSAQCTEGSVKGAADFARVRALNIAFRERQKSPFAKYGEMYECRLAATYCDHICVVESKQFSTFSKLAKTYCTARSEAYGTCDRYAQPQSVEEAAMVRYIDIQQKCAVNPTGVYSTMCNEGAAAGQAEDLRVACLSAAYRQGMKPVGQLLQEKYNQRKHGYSFTNGCNYEEGLVTKYPAIGASFRLKAYGF